MSEPARGGDLFLLVALLLTVVGVRAQALEIAIAPLAVSSAVGGERRGAECGRELERLMRERFRGGEVSFRRLDGRRYETPMSFLDAARISAEAGSDSLLYGYIRREERTWEAELKLFDGTARRITASFFARDASDRYERFIVSLADKVAEYLGTEAGLAAPVSPPPTRNIFAVPLGVGYPAAAGSGYARVADGLFRVETGLFFTPLRRYDYGPRPSREFRTGCLISYELASSSVGYEPFLLHSFGVRLPAAAVFAVADGDSLAIGGGIGIRFDLLDQKRLYYGRYTATSAVPTLAVGIEYRRRLRGPWSIGVGSGLEAALYSEPLTAILTGLRMVYEFSPPIEGG